VILRSVSTVRFRNLRQSQIELHPSVNLLVGDNGQGKTNILEAIYFLATTKSFRTSSVDSLVSRGDTLLYVSGETVSEEGLARTLSIGIESGESRRRELQVNGQKVALNAYLSVLQLFAYSSARLEIIRGGPEERRRFLDRGIASIDPGYLKNLSRYTQTLKQRNAVLGAIKARGASRATLTAWDEQLIQAASPIVASRGAYVTRLKSAFSEVTSSLGYHVDSIELDYRPAGISTDDETSRQELGKMRARELATGHSLVGPHRDVLEISLSGVPAAEYLSGGELKMVVLLLKLSKINIYRERRTEPPIFLLDDLDAELDLGITQRLLETLVGTTQIVTTSAKASVFNDLEFGPHRRFRIQSGEVAGRENFAS